MLGCSSLIAHYWLTWFLYQHNFSNNNKLFAEKTVEQGLLSVRLLEARLLVLRGETAGARAVGVVERSSVFVEGGEIEEVRLAADRTTVEQPPFDTKMDSSSPFNLYLPGCSRRLKNNYNCA